MIVYGVLGKLLLRKEQEKLEERLRRRKLNEDIPDPFVREGMQQRYHNQRPVVNCFYATIEPLSLSMREERETEHLAQAVPLLACRPIENWENG